MWTLSKDITGLLLAVRIKQTLTDSLIYLLMSIGKHLDVD